jgi:hypothetical protein
MPSHTEEPKATAKARLSSWAILLAMAVFRVWYSRF